MTPEQFMRKVWLKSWGLRPRAFRSWLRGYGYGHFRIHDSINLVPIPGKRNYFTRQALEQVTVTGKIEI